jgi:hypothetical protein
MLKQRINGILEFTIEGRRPEYRLCGERGNGQCFQFILRECKRCVDATVLRVEAKVLHTVLVRLVDLEVLVYKCIQ